MANSFHTPFNHDPVSTTIEATTYSLAAGKYARITPMAFGSALVADGETLMPALKGANEVTTDSTTYVAAISGNEFCPVLVRYYTKVENGGAGQNFVQLQDSHGEAIFMDAYGGQTASSFGTTSTTYVRDLTNFHTDGLLLRDGDTLAHKAANATGIYTSFVKYSYSPAAPFTPPSFWVSGGSSGITVTAERFVVELYNSIS